ncbi:acyltransferase family protein [Qipengyuania gaetbuli]|uniref:acyltransferase family protein n=1 Tax=Qipengyuania gaetbuli TaxID=266952 RepID=UPI001CFC76D9|nr:acyltransferase [Qipengyuania gaetbuli]
MMQGSRYATLDAMRGMAAIAVMVWHTPGGSDLVPGGFLAVDLFFAMSGFVIAMSYGERLTAGLPAATFMKLRIARLWPMLFLGAVPTVLVGGWAGSLILVPDPDARSLFPLTPVYWTLLFEMIAYVVFACGLYRLSTRTLVMMFGACGIMLAALALGKGPSFHEFGAFWFALPHGLARLAFPFLLGMLAYRHLAGTNAVRKETALAWLVPTGAVAAMCMVPTKDDIAALAFVLLAVPAALFLALRFEVPQVRIADRLSDLSYPLYCIHVTGLLVLEAAGIPASLSWALLIVLALYLDKIWDRPVRNWLRDVLTRSVRSRQPA